MDPVLTQVLRQEIDRAFDRQDMLLLQQFYHFWIDMAAWPTLVKLLRQLHQTPSNSVLALEIIFRSTAVLDRLRQFDKIGK
jgi:hypothetical protein